MNNDYQFMTLSRKSRAMSLLREKNGLCLILDGPSRSIIKIVIKVFMVWECGSVIVTCLAHTRPWVQTTAKTNY